MSLPERKASSFQGLAEQDIQKLYSNYFAVTSSCEYVKNHSWNMSCNFYGDNKGKIIIFLLGHLSPIYMCVLSINAHHAIKINYQHFLLLLMIFL